MAMCSLTDISCHAWLSGSSASTEFEVQAGLLDGLNQEPVAGRARDGEVEGGVLAHELRVRARCGHALRGGTDRGKLPFRSRSRRGVGRSWLDDLPEVDRLADEVGRLSHLEHTEIERAVLLGGCEHEGAARTAPARRDQPIGLEHPDRKLDRHPPDPEQPCQFSFRWKCLARRDDAKANLPPDLLGDVLMRPLLLDCAEDRLDIRIVLGRVSGLAGPPWQP